MKNLLRLIVVGLVFHSSVLLAADWGSWLRMYNCRSQGELSTCRGCSLIDLVRVRFATDEGRQRVFMQHLEEGNVKTPIRLSDCDVVDKNNWSCNSTISYLHLMQVSKEDMSGGVFRSHFHEYPSNGDDIMWCAK